MDNSGAHEHSSADRERKSENREQRKENIEQRTDTKFLMPMLTPGGQKRTQIIYPIAIYVFQNYGHIKTHME